MKQILEQAVQLPADEQFSFLQANGVTIETFIETLKHEDSVIRDQIASQIMMNATQWQTFSDSQLKEMVELISSDDYMFYKIGSKGDQTVYTRSNAILWLTMIFQQNTVQRLFSEEEATVLMEKITSYLYKEKDLRGYVPNEGWANAVTNAMNLYITLIKQPTVNHKYIPEILLAIKRVIYSDTVFIDDEEAKFAHFIQSLEALQYPEDVLVEWIEQLYDHLQFQLYEHGYTAEFYKHRTNLTHTMQALYFKLKFSRCYPKLQGTASIFLSKWA